jgi:hypothetical protein
VKKDHIYINLLSPKKFIDISKGKCDIPDKKYKIENKDKILKPLTPQVCHCIDIVFRIVLIVG